MRSSHNLLEIHSLTLKSACSIGDDDVISIIDNFNLSLPAGQICGLIGPNGAGKTAIFNMLELNYSLLEPSIIQPEIADGQISHIKDRTVMITDHVSVADSDKTVMANLRAHENSKGENVNSGFLDHVLRSLDLKPYCKQKFKTISDGVKRKVEIACALLSKPKLLLIDEPCKNLDSRSSAVVQALIRQIAHEQDMAVLLASRQPDVIRSLCDRVVVIRNGKTLLDHLAVNISEIVNGDFFRLKLQGEIDVSRSTWFGGLVQITGRNLSELTVFISDQAALHSLLSKIRDLSIPLISVEHLEPTVEVVLNHLMYAPVDDLSFQAKQKLINKIGDPHA